MKVTDDETSPYVVTRVLCFRINLIKSKKTLASKNTPDSVGFNRKTQNFETWMVKFRPIFIYSGFETGFVTFFFSHLLVAITEEYILFLSKAHLISCQSIGIAKQDVQ